MEGARHDGLVKNQNNPPRKKELIPGNFWEFCLFQVFWVGFQDPCSMDPVSVLSTGIFCLSHEFSLVWLRPLSATSTRSVPKRQQENPCAQHPTFFSRISDPKTSFIHIPQIPVGILSPTSHKSHPKIEDCSLCLLIPVSCQPHSQNPSSPSHFSTLPGPIFFPPHKIPPD